MDDEEDEFIYFGTALPEIEEEAELRKKAARELEVRDERGRQRFHGAFTGGFSAGYFNTVGTKEGWAPSTFVSSRNKISERVQQNPEDFMDEEDLGEFGIATRKIHTSSKFKDQFNSEVKKRKYNELDSIIPGEAPLKELVKPVRDSIGVEILRKLGWRPGQGIGPRVKKNEKNVKIYGCSLPDASSFEEDDPIASLYTYAPDDSSAIIYQPKDDCFGLGYSGLSKQSVLTSRPDEFNPTFTKSFLKKDKKKLTISGQAFGVGAFEDDDDDIYSKDDMTQYDFSEFEKEPEIEKGTKSIQKSMNNILEGFCLASQPLVKKYYPPPDLPADFIPMYSKLTIKKKSRFDSPHTPSQNKLTAEERSYLLGEKKFQTMQIKKPSSIVTEKLEVKDDTIPFSTDKSSFKPFYNDSAKQKRYEEFLKLQQSGDVSKLVLPPSMTEWEKQQELEEFSRSAMLFKPLSRALSSKFESRSTLSVEHEVMDAIEKAKNNKILESTTRKKLVGLKNQSTFDWYPSAVLCKRFNVPNPYPDSIPSGVSVSQQSKSLFEHLSIDNTPSKEVIHLEPSHLAISLDENITLTSVKASPKDIPKINEPDVKPETTLEGNSVSNNQRPPMDFFKDIFQNSSSEDEEDLSKKEKQLNIESQPNKNVEEKDMTPNKVELNVPLKEKPPPVKKCGFGVFANLDLDALNKKPVTKNSVKVDQTANENRNMIETPNEDVNILKKSNENLKPKEKPNENINLKKNTSKNIQNMECVAGETHASIAESDKPIEQNDLYGPELPPDYSENSISSSINYSKKHKLKHKHKHHKHKSKKKKKKNSYRSSDSSDIEEDISPALILETLKKIKKI